MPRTESPVVGAADDSSDDEPTTQAAVPPARTRPPAYFGFCAEHRAAIKAQNPGMTPREVGQQLGKMWRALDQAVRQRYADEAGPQPKRKARGPAKPKKGRGWNGGRPKKVNEPPEGGE